MHMDGCGIPYVLHSGLGGPSLHHVIFESLQSEALNMGAERVQRKALPWKMLLNKR